jgi:transcriptional regulator with XRE-family HTH domain
MSETFKPFPCAECGSTVRPASARGEWREFRRGVRVHIPDDVLVPRCEGCGEMYLGEDDSARLDASARRAFLAEQVAVYARCVAALQREHGTTLRDIERVCGVTPTYFSHVMKGRRVASLTLTRLLEAFVAAPGEFERHREQAGGREGGEARRGIAGVVTLKPVGAVRPKARSAFAKPHAWPAVPAALQGAA